MIEAVLEAKSLSYSVPQRKILLDVSFRIPKESFTVVVGENGAGKTTLLQLLMGFIEPSNGTAWVNGKEPYRDPFHDRNEIGFIAEKITPPVDWSVDDFLEFNRFFYKTYSEEIEKELLRELRLSRDWRIGSLSAGQIRRVQVVGVLASSPKLLIIDEITAVLDIVGRSKFMKALGRLRSQHGSTVVMATNILDDVDTYATDVVLLHQGKLRMHDTKENLIRSNTGATLTETLSELIEKAEEEDEV